MNLDRYGTSLHVNQKSDKMPVLFLGHGNPMNAIESNQFTSGIIDIGKTIKRPDLILCISAHWETKGTYVTAMDNPRTIHDFGGFPKELYDVEYPAKGSPELARRITSLLKNRKIGLDFKWGLDHGAWSVIKHLYPEADVPIVQMSIDYMLAPQEHYDLMEQLAPLRNEGVLIIGSGNMVHNLGKADWLRINDEFGFDWAIEAGDKMKKFILENNHKQLINYRCHGKPFELAIPTPEHYLPLLYALAVKDEGENIEIFNDKPVAGSLMMTSLKIG